MPRHPSLEVRLYQIGAAFAAVVAIFVVLGVGCSKTTVPPINATVPADAASTADIVPNIDAGWSDASVPESLDATQACARYMRAVCERKNECGLGTDDCAKAVANCPDSLFSLGSTRDPVSAWQCAALMRQRSCLDVYMSTNPECVTKGTRNPGESCISAAQCESLVCTGSGATCGTCLPRVGKGQNCASTLGVVCDRGLTCDGSTNTCIDLPVKTFDAVVSTGLEIGKACDSRNVCATGAYCKLSDGGSGVCTARIAEEGSCTVSESCLEGTYCFIEGYACRKIPAAGSKCGNDAVTNNAFWCTDDAYCDNKDYLCKPLPLAGAPCAATQLSGGPILCAPSAICDTAATPPTCKALAGPAESCTEDAACQKGLKCLCGDSACAQKSCSTVRDIGESCANPGEICNTISTCTDGICKSNPSQGLYATFCGA